jgi:hypothetical protein
MNLIELERSLRQLGLGGMAAVLETRLHQAQAEPMAPRIGQWRTSMRPKTYPGRNVRPVSVRSTAVKGGISRDHPGCCGEGVKDRKIN